MHRARAARGVRPERLPQNFLGAARDIGGLGALLEKALI